MQKIFNSQQLSRFFQIAIIINLIGLLSDIIVYRYFSDYEILKSINENLSNLSIFIVCCIIISQAILIFIKHHKKLITRYELVAITLIITIAVFLFWLLTIDNDIQEKFIIFCSSTSRTDHDVKMILALIGIFCMLIFNFYNTLEYPDKIDNRSVPEMIISIFKLVIKKYFLIFLSIFGIFHFHTIPTFTADILNYSKSSIYFNVTLLKILIPLGWIGAFGYYLYKKYQK
jgi:hypothetical protein